MKKITLVLFTLLTLLPLGVWADEITTGNVTYTYTVGEPNASVKIVASETNVTIPATITIDDTEYTVNAIDKEAFKDCGSLQTLIITPPQFIERS